MERDGTKFANISSPEHHCDCLLASLPIVDLSDRDPTRNIRP